MKKSAKKRTQIPEKGTPERHEAGELEFLSRSATAFLDFPQDGDLFALIADLLSDRLKNDAILAISDYDEKANVFRPRAIRGLETMLAATKKILGQDPMELAGEFGTEAKKALASGKFQKVEVGLRDFSNNLLPGPVAKAIEKLLGLSGFYVAGFEKKGKIMGGLSIVTRKQTALPEAALLEAFAGQAAVALERRRAEDSLRESESTMRVFLNVLPGPAILISRDGIILEVNKSMAQRMGRSRLEIIGQRAFSLIPPEIAAGRIAHFETVLKTGRPEIFEDGRAGVFYLNYMFPVVDEKNEVSKVAVFALDISDRKKAEDEIKSSEERLALLFEHAPDAYYLSDLKGTFIDGNREAEKLLGYRREELVGKNFLKFNLLSTSQLPKAAALLAKNMLGKPTGPNEFVLRRKDGTEVATEIRTHPVKIKDRTLVLGIARDVTDRKQSDEALKESERRFRGLSSLTNEGIMIHEGGIIQDANLAFAQLVGYSNPDNLAGKNGMEIIPFTSESRQCVLAHMRSGSTETYEVALVKSDGSIFPAETRGKEIIYEGRPMRLVAMRDITERKRAEERLAKSERRFRHLAELLPQIVFETDTRGNITFANQFSLKSFGYRPEDLRSEINFLSLIAPQDRETVQKRFQEIVRGTETAAREYQALRKDGSSFPIILHANAILEEGVPMGVRGIGIDITERKRAEEALRESEEKYRAIIETNQEWIWQINTEGKHTYSNRALEQILGYSIKDIVGRDATIFMHPDDRRNIEEMLPKLIENRKGWNNLVVRWLHKDGSIRWLESNAVAMLDATGELIGFQGSDRDITERERAEEARRKSEEKFSKAFRSSPIPLAITRLSDGKFVEMNGAMEEIFEYHRDEWIGRSTIDLGLWVNEDDRKRVVRSIEADEPVRDQEFSFRSKNGRIVVARYSAEKIEIGEEKCLMSVIEDITERKRAEEALRESEEYFRSLIEKGSDVISVMDKNAIIQYISPSVERVLGYKPEELIGTSGFALVHPDDLKRLSAREDFIAVLGVPGSFSPVIELRDRHKDGTWLSLEVIARSIVDTNGELAIVTNAHDITERKKAEEALRLSAVRLRRTLNDAINALSSAIEMRDPYTAGHQERVTKLAVAIAQEMHLSEESIETLRIAGLVHDIGKMSVPAEILSKPTRLTEVEFSLIKTHAEAGYMILNKIDFPWPVARIVHEHHERIDGSGYPRGLTRSDLLTESKILCLADVVEAMSSHRPYRAALGIEVALREISEKRGILYDPDVVEACLKLFADNKFRF
jgi:PAS domain S-box-containing protein/putative nucleotidyltransferase with HDIG domain